MSTSSLTAFTIQFNRITPIPIVVLGCMGNILNILVFTRQRLIKNPCSTYFLCSSIANLIVLIFGLVSRFFSDGLGIDPVSTNLGFCRFRYFILHCSMVLSSWFTILAGIDRYWISSRNVQRRQLSNLKNARYLVILTTLIGVTLYSHVLILFTIEQLKSGPYCYAQTGIYRIFYDLFYVTTFALIPPTMMIIVGLATVYQIRRSRLNIQPLTINNNTNVNQLKKRDRQLLKMTLVQFIFIIIVTSPIAVQKLYATFTQNVIKGAFQLALENFLAQLMRMLVYINSSTSFYVFFATGHGFRCEFDQFIVKIIGCLCGRHTRLHRRAQIFFGDSSITQRGTMNQSVTILNHHQSMTI
ncbi:unnamed protein product [Rotaria sp. Silwood1]|nr:unnamed protein product [Rotaria sp. Silwood1]CAF3474347.1 unnamed protein product [Rotaria sp. Silwood1]CAF4951444.1 unnamed protein product [Rotaria sp. Silwood1]